MAPLHHSTNITTPVVAGGASASLAMLLGLPLLNLLLLLLYCLSLLPLLKRMRPTLLQTMRSTLLKRWTMTHIDGNDLSDRPGMCSDMLR